MSDAKLYFVTAVYKAPVWCVRSNTLVDTGELLYTDSLVRWQNDLADPVTVHLAEVCIIKLGHIRDSSILTAADASFILASNSDIPELHCKSFENYHALA